MKGKSLVAGVIVAVIYFLLGGFFYGWLMRDWFAAQSTGTGMTEPRMAVLALMCLAYGLLMGYTYPIGYHGGSPVSEGMRFGILYALIVNLPSGLGIVAMGTWTWMALFVGLIWEIICGAGLGIITARVHGGAARVAAQAL